MTGYNKMQEDEFDKLDFPLKRDECKKHDFVKLYYSGTHSDYGCIRCGFKTLTPEQYPNSSSN